MDIEIIVRYLHFIGIFGIVSALVSQHLFYKPEMTRAEIKRISVIDLIYGISALLAFAMGLLLWLKVGKSTEFYTKNPHMHIKLTLFVIMGLLSIKPTMFFLKNRKGDQNEVVNVPKSIIMMIRMELLLVFIMPLLAIFIAKGI